MKTLIIILFIASNLFAVADSNLVAWYKMDDNADSNTVIDTQEYSNGAFSGNSAANNYTSANTTAGKIGRALSFNGTSDYIDTGNTFQSTFRNSFSVSAWVKANDGIKAASQTIAGQYLFDDGATTSFVFWITIVGKFQCYIETAAGSIIMCITDTVIFADGANDWKMVTAVITKDSNGEDTGRIDLYVNGLLVKTGTPDIISLGTYTQTVNFGIGCLNADEQGSWFDGYIDDYRIYNKALSAAEINQLYRQSIATIWTGADFENF